jgi:membrane protease YdiL (CAAX protease family)
MTTIVPAVLIGVAVLLAGSLPWGALLAPLNVRFAPTVPWAILPMAIYLWVYWRYIGGRIGSGGAARQRREKLRANPLAPDVWAMALLTGLTGFGAVLSLTAVMARLMVMPESGQIVTPPGMPAATVIALLVMASVVAGVTEEAAFRGYMQGPIERRYGLTTAILVNGVMFGLLHFPNHREAVVAMLPYYVAVTAVYSGVTWAANSILPAVALHVGGDVWSLARLWATGQPEWQRSGDVQPLVWDTGPDTAFMSAVVLLIVFSGAATALCWNLRKLAIRVGSTARPTSALDQSQLPVD